MSVVYFCFICDQAAMPGLEARHYEDERVVRFCGPEHEREYEWLHRL